ncbi:MAG: aminotransferase class I/II-fold pyridoxal phosphate-dependent enzyme [Thermomicrobiales bacterium]|nr:aminotransferase class I/II-fold pyridoxal phosphate-dependent enzyme [Thermomicrobiales bacterium]
MIDQNEAPFFDALRAFATGSGVPFSTPGHKRGIGAPQGMRDLLPDALGCDVPHGGGVDTTHLSYGLLKRAEALAAAAYSGDSARYLVNGSTTGNVAMLMSVANDSDTVLVTRMLHKSLMTGLIQSGARPVYLTPEIHAERNLPIGVAPSQVAEALARHADARAVVLASPSYVGISSDLRSIADICHAANVPLLVDEAWGPHLHFHPAVGPSAMQAGADAAVSSTHKMLAALTQGSTLVARRERIDVARLDTLVDMTQTTSPSALIYASLDASRRQMALEGEALLSRAIHLATELRSSLTRLPGLAVVSDDIVSASPGARLDPTRIMIDVHQLGWTGYEAEEFLRTEHGVYVEMSDLLSVMLLITIGDSEESIERAAAGLTAMAAQPRPVRHAAAARSLGELLYGGEAVTTPREAFTRPSRVVSVEASIGEISAEAITPYPPGVPIVAPGERIQAATVDYLRIGLREGMYISGMSDPTCETIRVIA